MSTLYLLIPLAAILVLIAAGLFIWSIKSGQFEDMEGPGFRILMDDDEDMIPDDAKVKKPKTEIKTPVDE
jgi:cbb3-type cytochrome oxidase maturation protein